MPPTNSAMATGASSSGNLNPFLSMTNPMAPVMPNATKIFSR